MSNLFNKHPVHLILLFGILCGSLAGGLTSYIVVKANLQRTMSNDERRQALDAMIAMQDYHKDLEIRIIKLEFIDKDHTSRTSLATRLDLSDSDSDRELIEESHDLRNANYKELERQEREAEKSRDIER
jgi:hypothetical protein